MKAAGDCLEIMPPEKNGADGLVWPEVPERQLLHPDWLAIISATDLGCPSVRLNQRRAEIDGSLDRTPDSWREVLANASCREPSQEVVTHRRVVVEGRLLARAAVPIELLGQSRFQHAAPKSSPTICVLELGERCAQPVERRGFTDQMVVWARVVLEVLLEESSGIEEALQLSLRVLADHERVLGPVDLGTLDARNNLANVYATAGRVRDALELREEVLADYAAFEEVSNRILATSTKAKEFSKGPDFDRLCDELHDRAAKLGEAAKAKNGKASSDGLAEMKKVCKECHSKHR